VALEFRLPDIGEGLTEAEIVEWFVEVGADVTLDQPLVQIETDKAVTEVPAPRAGTLLHRGGEAGTVVKVGELLAVIGDRTERWTEAPRDSETQGPAAPAAPIVGSLEEAEEVAAPAGVQALPVVRKMAKDLGVDLNRVRGTGPGGRITREDVEAAAGARPTDEERVRLSKLRRTIAENTARSWREIPHVTTFGEADAASLLSARADLERRLGRRVPLEALFIRAVIPPLRAHPEFNASVDGQDLVLKRRYDIGVAVDTPEGLVVAVVKGADRRGIPELAEEIERVAEAARSRTATPAELSGQTFTVSNIGAVGGGFGTPIIPFGTTAILSFGRVREQPVARGGRVVVGSVLPLSLSYDHRAIDGALGRRFLAAVIEHLEDPQRILSDAR